MVTVCAAESNWGKKFTIFEVPLQNRPPVFMSVKEISCDNKKNGVVIVDSEKFLDLWRKDIYSGHQGLSHGNPQTWINDKKYPEQAKYFSFGRDNPVPLALVSCEIGTRPIVANNISFGRDERKEQFRYVTFTNGITRTIWLLTNGCEAFPIECEMPRAKYLHQIAAVPGTDLFTVDELT